MWEGRRLDLKGDIFSGMDGGQKFAQGFVSVSVSVQKSLAMLVSPSHCLICIPRQRRRKGGLGDIWVDQALPHFPCLPPPHEDFSPARMVGVGVQKVHWIGWGPLGVQRAEKFLGIGGVGPAPAPPGGFAPAQCLASQPLPFSLLPSPRG